MNWQPIETAPKDGSDILVFFRGSQGNKSRQVIAMWEDDKKDVQTYDGFWIDAHVGEIIPNVTHWMPLPEPPHD